MPLYVASGLLVRAPRKPYVALEQLGMFGYRPPCSRSERSEASVAARGGGYQLIHTKFFTSKGRQSIF